MNEFSKYIEKLLKKTQLTRLEKKDLEKELVEHLNNMKDDYLKKGISEKESINMAIKNFNNSDFIKEINNFAANRKLTGLNISYLFKVNIILILVYSILMIGSFLLFTTNQDLNILYFLIICFILFVNYDYTSSHFESQKDIFLNMSITCLVFFCIEKIGILTISKIYSILSNNLELNISDLYVFQWTKILIYLVMSVIGILFAKYHTPNSRKRDFKLSTGEIFILILSLILSIIYFLYPNRFYLLNLVISRMFNTDVQSFSKNLLYMNINHGVIIINVGLVLILLFIFYKFISCILKIDLKNNKF